MSRDSSRTYLHLHLSSHADLFEEFTRSGPLQPDEIFLPPQYQPLNPEDEDDVVPDMHAAFGIQRATMKGGEKPWKDYGLDELLRGFLHGEEGKNAPAAAKSNGDQIVKSGMLLRVKKRVEGTAGARLRG